MDFRIADTFTTSLGRLSGEEQKAVKTTAFDLQVDPSGVGMQFHRLDKGRDRNFWSVRVSRDVRLIVHRTAGSLLLCYVGHHDDAYQWAERRRLEVHPRTGAAQFVEVRERVEEVVRRVEVPAPVAAAAKAALFASVPLDDLMACGVPVEWVDEVRRTTEDTLLDLAEHLPAEAAEALLVLGTGGVPRALQAEVLPGAMLSVDTSEFMARDTRLQLPESAVPAGEPLDRAAFEHPDALRRFRIVTNVEELERALDAPWDKWTVFLHPAQRETVQRQYGGPARVSGSAGTGKTIVALHRAVFLARSRPEARVLLTTFSGPLANALRTKLRRLVGNEPRIAERLDVHAVDAIARRLYELNLGRPQIATRAAVRDAIRAAAGDGLERPLTLRFLTNEWDEVVDAWHIDSWEAYRDVARLGRKTRLPERQRRAAWGVFEKVRASLAAQGVMTQADLLNRLAAHLPTLRQPPFDHVVVDEAQDLSVAQLRFLAALGGGRPDALFFAGDLGQRIFQLPFSWKALGVDVRGRSRTLRVNYRTSHQIRASADRLLGPEVADVDGNKEDRRGTVSVFNGPEPVVSVFDTPQLEREAVARWLSARAGDGIKPHEIAVFVRSDAEIPRACAAVAGAGLSYRELDEKVETVSGSVSISTMHLAKGLEFRAVAVMACDDEVMPLKERIESVADDSDLQEVYETERHLLYVACTRARDWLIVTGVVPASEYLEDMLLESPRLLSVDEYHRMIETGILDEDERVELLEGVIVTMTPQSPAHAHCIRVLTRLLSVSLGSQYSVGVQLPLTLGRQSEPEPDLAVVRADALEKDRHPGTAVLVIEVARESLRRDRRVKGALYARFGVQEYWIVNLEERVVEVLTDPEPASGSYRRTRVCATAETLASEALPEVAFPVASLFD